MREISSPIAVDLDRYRNLSDLLWERNERDPEAIAFDVPDGNSGWAPRTVREFFDLVVSHAKGLIAAGVEPGQRVAVLSPTRFEWSLLDFAILSIGAVVVPVYETSAPAQIASILGNSEAVAGFAATPELAERLRGAFGDFERSARVWSMDEHTDEPDLRDLVAAGRDVPDAEVERRRVLADSDSIASIVYTSGTTSAPKGALITHGNFLGQVSAVADAYHSFVNADASTIIFLPMAHVLARGVFFICFASGTRVAVIGDPKQAVPAMAELAPTFVMVVPRVLEKILGATADAAREKRLEWLWRRAEVEALIWGRMLQDRDRDPSVRTTVGQRIRHLVFDRLFYAKVRAKLGGRMRVILSGAAPLAPATSLTFRGMGIPIVEGYGLTETTAPVTGNRIDDFVAGTVGYPMPGSSIRIAEDGEVLAKGLGVCAGYTTAEATAAAFTDGWFHTGDFGELDDQGRLRLRGRRGDMIVTAGGKNMLPGEWEQQVESLDLVAHAVVVGEGKPFLGSLIVLDPEAVKKWALRERISDLPSLELPDIGGYLEVAHERLRETVARVVEEANQMLSRAEQIRRFELVIADLSDAGGMVTPTLKLKRRVFVQRMRAVVETIYGALPGTSR